MEEAGEHPHRPTEKLADSDGFSPRCRAVQRHDRRRAEDALRESELRFRLALRNAPVSVAAQDRDLKYVWAFNQRTARPEQIVGHFDHQI